MTASVPRRSRRAAVVANPTSGRGRAARAAEAVAQGLARRGFEAEVHLTRGRGDAPAWLRAQGDDLALVVAAGGDGTVRECFEGLANPEIPVGMLPLGTANVLALELGAPRDVERAVEVFAAGRARPIDVARVNGRLSFLVTSAGIDAETVREVELRRRGPITKWSYVPAFLAALRRTGRVRMAVEVDGARLPGTFGMVLVSNVRFYGGVLRLDPAARIDDGLFEVYLFPTARIPELCAAFVRGVLHHLPGGAVERVRARSVRLEADGPVPYQVDGDTGAMLPLHLEVQPVRYRVLAP